MIKSIRKRDGRLVDFEVDKIAGALYKAFSACFDKVELKKVYAIAHDVEKRLEEKESTLPTVELVQDTVEEILIEEGYVRVAKAYILYRDKRSRSRDMKSILLESIENESSDDINLFDVFENLMNGYKIIKGTKSSFYYCQTSSAISLTSLTLFHCSSLVSKFPSSVEAKPHCGDSAN